MDSTSIGLAFRNLSVSSLVPPNPILSNVNGFVKKGGITAVFGASSSGKSLLLQAMAGRVQSLSVSGKVFVDGLPIDPTSVNNSIAYVSQFDMLIGDLTAKEMITTSATLKRKATKAAIDGNVNAVLKEFAIDKVADTYIGTIFRAGLSGGQKRRVEVGIELVAPPSILLLDEPTSGLDGSIAFEVLQTIRNRVDNSDKKLSVMLSIHQPNSRILSLFDHILVLGQGNMTFFGTLEESIAHFTSIGVPPPAKYTPTDFYLQVTDCNFSDDKRIDFEGAFCCSKIYFDLVDTIDDVEHHGLAHRMEKLLGTSEVPSGANGNGERASTPPTVAVRPVNQQDLATLEAIENGETENGTFTSTFATADTTSLWTQYIALLHRELLVALRDPTLYYLQFMFVFFFGVMVGCVFYNLDYKIDSSMYYVPGGLLWICMMMIYIQVFKVYHLRKADIRFAHEYANKSYSVLAYWLAELTTSSLGLAFYIPGTAVAYFMMGFPREPFPFLILLFWTAALTSESMLNFITKFFSDISAAVVTSQLVLVILTAFGGGLFIRWDETPSYWLWLQIISLFTHSSRAASVRVIRELVFDCTLQGGKCFGPSGDEFRCSLYYPDGIHCAVNGGDMLFTTQGIESGESPWNSYGYLVVILVIFRFSSLFLMYYPVQRVWFQLQTWYYSPTLTKEIVSSHLNIRRLRGQVRELLNYHLKGTEIDIRAVRGYSRKFERIPSTEPLDDVPAGHDEHGNGNGPPSPAKTTMLGVPSSSNLMKMKHALVWNNLSLSLKSNPSKVLIDNVSGYVECGRVLALMGPSGAGKTTLLNALSNRAPYGNVTGSVYYANRTFHPNDLMYVPQFDEIKGYLTVMEQIMYVGTMKCKDIPAMKQRLMKLLQILGLFSKAQTLCKDLSGGELKRVSVGMGMISNPKVLFLDEPTTGLDSTAAFYLVKYLVTLAFNTNVAVIMTIHQPAAIVFDMLQDLYLLESGRLAYFGPISHASMYFTGLGLPCPSEFNPADFYLENIYKPPVNQAHEVWRDIYYNSDLGKYMEVRLRHLLTNNSTAASSPSGASEEQDDTPSNWSRFMTVLIFFSKYYLICPGYYIYRVLYLICCAVFLGTLFLHLQTNTNELTMYSGSIFFNIWSVLFAAVGSTGVMASDRRQSFEQIKNGIISPGIYSVAQFLSTLPYNLACSVVFQAIFHWLTNINPNGTVFIYAIIITALHLVLMESIMSLVVEVVKDSMLSVTLAMVIMGILFLFPGFFIQVNDMPIWIRWMSYIVPTKYSFDGYVHEIFHSQTFHVSGVPGMEVGGSYVLENVYDNKNVNAWGMVGVIIAFILFIRCIHYLLFAHAAKPFTSGSITAEEVGSGASPSASTNATVAAGTATVNVKPAKSGAAVEMATSSA